MRLVLVSAWIDSCSVPGKVYIDPPKFCSHPEHSVYKDVGILAKRNARWLSKCHHRRLAVNEQATRLINCDIYRHFYLSQLFFCHQTGLDLWPSRKIKPTLPCSFKSSYWTQSTIWASNCSSSRVCRSHHCQVIWSRKQSGRSIRNITLSWPVLERI